MVGVSPLIIGILGASVIVGRCLQALGLAGNAEAFNRATGIAINWGVLALCALIAIIEFFAPGTF